MNDRDFCYWLRGYLELSSVNTNTPGFNELTKEQVSMIWDHLSLVFYKQTPQYKIATLKDIDDTSTPHITC